MIKKTLFILIWLFIATQTAWSQNIDHGRWNTLLNTHVSYVNKGNTTVVDYDGMMKDRHKLKLYLKELSSVTVRQFDQWTKDKQLAFLINAYNAWTVELILTAWPDLESIKDLGWLFSPPWRKEFVDLLGKTRSLDDIEHRLIRESGRYNDPRIHFAINCASIGCPALRPEAYVGSKINRQLDEQAKLFLGDRSRNRFENDTLMLSPIFKWYREDFEKAWLGFRRLEDFLAAHADTLALNPALADRLKAGDVPIEFLDYDWRLNKKL